MREPCKPALQNNIGASLLLQNSPSAAKERFYASIATSGSKYNESLSRLVPEHICPKINVEIPGLVWFDNKLKNEVAKHCHPRNDDLEARVPLGLEYFQYPIRVHSSIDARIAAAVNLALLLFREPSCPIEQVLSVLQWALALGSRDIFDVHEADPMLLVIAHSNMGVLRFMQDKYKPAFNNFEKAASILQQLNSESKAFARRSSAARLGVYDYDPLGRANDHKGVELPRDYVELAVMLNFTRAAIHMNDERTPQICDHLQDIASSISYKDFYRIKWIVELATKYIPGLLNQQEEHFERALECYNSVLSITRKEWGHDHIHVAIILEKKGRMLFDQRKYQHAMLSYLASWKIYEHAGPEHIWGQSRLLFAIARTLHDGEEFADALGMYQKALALRKKMDEATRNMKSVMINSIQIWCNICRIQMTMGNLDEALESNERIVQMASDMVGGGETAASHAFVRNRMIVLGNLYTEMGRLDDAMDVFIRVARENRDGDWMITSQQPEMEDIDTNAFAVQAAKRLGRLKISKPHAAAA